VTLRGRVVGLLLLLATGSCAWTPRLAEGQTTAVPPASGTAQFTGQQWQWTVDANAFIGFNYQRRKFRDFDAWESQNWLMAVGQRPVGRATLTLSSMLSLEALTVSDLGSPQVFQTGETFRRAPLIDYQHPHDLIMGLGAEYRRPLNRATLFAAAELVGSPSIGPPVFMHRPSAIENPQVPLSHHTMDSTHVTPGVLRAGVVMGEWRGEASVFRGREPDENRLDIDLGALDSTAMRLTWTRNAWSAQASAAYLTEPEFVTPSDAKRLSASLSRTAPSDARGVSWLAAFGQNREIHGNLEAYLFEATIRANARNAVYTRVESVAKSILDAGFHPPNIFHRHRQSQVGALTIGYVRDVLQPRIGGFAVGVDVTGYTVPANLDVAYGSPVSFHVFLRYRAPRPLTGAHVHVH
jgi:hypothetical protein